MAIVFATELGLFQRFLETEPLSFRQWLVCIALAFFVVPVSEVRKAILRRQKRSAGPEAGGEVAAAPAPVA